MESNSEFVEKFCIWKSQKIGAGEPCHTLGIGSTEAERTCSSQRSMAIQIPSGSCEFEGFNEGNKALEMATHQETQQDGQRGKPFELKFSKFSRLTSFLQSALKTWNFKTLVLAYHTMGIVYGGIGTSPLYIFSSIKLIDPIEEDFLGVFSIIFWTLTLVGICKYSLIVLQADDHGEGGTLALFSLLSQYTNIPGTCSSSKRFLPSSRSHIRLTHVKMDPNSIQSKLTKLVEGSKRAQKLLFSFTALATCMLIGDGILTPAISVLSAVGGLKTAVNSLNQSVIVLISATLLVVLFLLQKFGTEHVSFVFSPIIVTWLLTIGLIGGYNIIANYPMIFKAVSPKYILRFFSRRGKEGWLSLAGTVICITGAEAIFADMGHFNKRSMQIAFIFGVYPSLVACYAGETAYLIKYPKDQDTVFYKFIPKTFFWPMFLVSTLAAIVASQALISACFSLIKQLVALDYFPRVQILHTSKEHEGQIYSPEINYFLMFFCVATVLGFRDEYTLGNAYGVTVIMVMLITTCLFTLVMLIVWGTPLPIALAFLLFFSIIEYSYLSAVLSKVPQGGWFPFLVALLLSIIIFSWVHGRETKQEYESVNKLSFDDLNTIITTSNIKRVPGVCIFYSSLAEGLPPVIRKYLKTACSLHQVIVITTVQYAKVPKIPLTQRFTFCKLGQNAVYQCTALYGYAEDTRLEKDRLSELLMESLGTYINSLADESGNNISTSSHLPEDTIDEGRDDDSVSGILSDDLFEIETAKREGTASILGRTELVAKQGRKPWRVRVMESVYHFLHKNCSTTAGSLGIPPSNLLEIGMLYEV